VRAAFVGSDLLIGSRIAAAADATGADLVRVDHPRDLPPDGLDLVLVDWTARGDDWGVSLREWCVRAPESRLILYGPHIDLEAHAAARAAGVGPMWARSKLVAALGGLFGEAGRGARAE
jgi:hypothetical protein